MKKGLGVLGPAFPRLRRLGMAIVMLMAGTIAGYAAWSTLDETDGRTEPTQDSRFAPLYDYDPMRVYYPDDHWLKVVRPQIMGWSTTRLAEARNFSRSLAPSAVVVVENGVIVDA